MTPQAFSVIADLVKARSGMVLGPDKLYLLETRLAPVLRSAGLPSLEALAARLREPRSEILAAQVVEALTINETFFFRDIKPFNHLRDVTLPALHAARPAGTPIRIWSAAASTGQEAYSIAMILIDGAAQFAGRRFEILGTDISREALEKARAGLYTQFEVQRGVPMAALVKHFKKEGENWRISEAVRKLVTFREWNLLDDPRALGTFDVIFCRNVLIYFDAPTKKRVLDSLLRQLAPDGVVYLGGAETVLGLTDQLKPLAPGTGAYGRTEAKILPLTKPTSASEASPIERREVSMVRSGRVGAS